MSDYYFSKNKKGIVTFLYKNFSIQSYYQPIVYASNQLAGVEALMKVSNIDKLEDTITPESFLLSLSCKERASVDLKIMLMHIYNFSKSVYVTKSFLFLNIEGDTIINNRKTGLNLILRILGILNVVTSRIYLEVTERQCADEFELTVLVSDYRAENLNIVLDDFGDGINDCQRLLSLKPSVVKITKRLVKNFCVGDSNEFVWTLRKIRSSVTTMCLAEGVEELEYLEKLNKFNIELYQGYTFGRPMPI